MLHAHDAIPQGPTKALPSEGPPTPPEGPPTPVRLRGRVIGFVAAGVFRRTLRAEHYLRRPRAIAVDVDVLTQLDRLGVDVLEFTNAETGEVHATSLTRFLERSFPIDRGAGRQRAMPLAAFHVVSVYQVPLPGLEAVLSAFADASHG